MKPIVIASFATALIVAHADSGKRDEAPVRVQFREGLVHGFLTLHDERGQQIAIGKQIQIAYDSVNDARMSFEFADGSFYEEHVRYTQDRVFRMRTYHVTARGPSFPDDIDATLSASGNYTVVSRDRKDGSTKRISGTLDLPADTYNGMVVLIAKNLPAGTAREVHMVAFTPKPMLIGLEFKPTGRDEIRVGSKSASVQHLTLQPKIGAVKSVLAHVIGQSPPDADLWLFTEDTPAFVRFKGPLSNGPVRRIDLAAPEWK